MHTLSSQPGGPSTRGRRIYIYIYIYMTADIYSYTFKYFYSGLPVRFRKASGLLPGRGLLSYLLTGLLTDLLTEGTFTADAAAYGTADGVGLALRTEVHNSLNLLNLAPGPKRVPSRAPAVGGQWGAGARLGPVLTGTRTVEPCF
jgi:hypothetical protein